MCTGWLATLVAPFLQPNSDVSDADSGDTLAPEVLNSVISALLQLGSHLKLADVCQLFLLVFSVENNAFSVGQ